MDSLAIRLGVFQVDFVLSRVGIERAKLQEDLDGSLVLGGGDSLRAFTF